MSTFCFFVLGAMHVYVCYVFIYFFSSLRWSPSPSSFLFAKFEQLLYESFLSFQLCYFYFLVFYSFIMAFSALSLSFARFLHVAMPWIYMRYEFCGKYCNSGLHALVVGIHSNLVPLKHTVCIIPSPLIRTLCFLIFSFLVCFFFFLSILLLLPLPLLQWTHCFASSLLRIFAPIHIQLSFICVTYS